ncbi:Sulfotransferase domain-containing protein [Muriicola jejuensis]|uniref:Sulfotransferase domain-containing protein n=1 Tax=Muriicola jejuensis TaxID=504488 RepID=A0A6P0UFW9_9FLAO|nr:sulfotransferase domain-containing protein [Muriicola jejuensis]NER11522.1 hypothetical protein [Muriicola jejuensis]SMP20087.1 Sulfotransferase domain-containing protein [Muriicola jejuensis]
MKKIIIAGYPKSGNTWLTRLTATLADCPVKGFLYSDHQEIAVEGTDRISKYGVFKSHHQYQELRNEDVSTAKIIYVIRDPRDIAISGRNFFSVQPYTFKNIEWPTKNLFLKIINPFKIVSNKIINKLLLKKEMNKAVLFGNKKIHYWCRISWKSHITPYLENPDILIVKYESLLTNPFHEAKRIIDYIGINKTDKEIIDDVQSQSFKKKKTQFINQEQIGKASFLRSGKKEQWKSVLSKKENLKFVDILKNELIELGYELEN